jgi:hypothetical protein
MQKIDQVQEELPLTLDAVFKAGYEEGKQHLIRQEDIVPGTPNDVFAAAFTEAYHWLNCYDRGEQGFIPKAHTLAERWAFFDVFAAGYIAGAEQEQ